MLPLLFVVLFWNTEFIYGLTSEVPISPTGTVESNVTEGQANKTDMTSLALLVPVVLEVAAIPTTMCCIYMYRRKKQLQDQTIFEDLIETDFPTSSMSPPTEDCARSLPDREAVIAFIILHNKLINRDNVLDQSPNTPISEESAS